MQLRLPDRKFGVIHLLPSTFAIGPGLDETTFLNSAEGRASVSWVMNRPNGSYKVSANYECESQQLGMILWFSDPQITSVTLFPAPSASAATWDEWSESAETTAAKALEQLLSSVYGGQRQFGWGNIGVFFDPRSASASITVRYDGGA